MLTWTQTVRNRYHLLHSPLPLGEVSMIQDGSGIKMKKRDKGENERKGPK